MPISKGQHIKESNSHKSSSIIHQNLSTDSNMSVENSAPPSSATEIANFIGDDWLKDLSVDSSNPKENVSNIEKHVIESSDDIIENEQESRTQIANSSLKKNIDNTNETFSTEMINSIDSGHKNTSSDYIPSNNSTSMNESKSLSYDSDLPIKNDTLSIDVHNVLVPNSKNENKSYSLKQYFCPYCKKLQKKFALHLELKHKNITDVSKFMHFPKCNSERRKIIEKIRKYGNYLHNTDANLNTGTLILCRRPQAKFNNTVEDYVCCKFCKGFFSKRTLRIHYAKYNLKHEKGKKGQFIEGKQLMGYAHSRANDIMRRKIIPSFNDDNISKSIKYDELLILFGNKLCDTYTHSHQYDMIRNYLRLLGRFKLAIKGINNQISDFASIFHPKYYDDVIKAVKICANYNSELQIFQTPYNATTLGTLFKKCVLYSLKNFKNIITSM
ncbi:hypothetical protein ALC57_14528 [Trachymyrmex cornetzi]|uniref:Uncharacterized protein n=1 Tax=Trachymyrmex cornetzi TaxID=471704 RepID=A0A151IYD9_9HYME|nr:hypothetical protein ALC57_14528 [Trachymyrmex cornetzi]